MKFNEHVESMHADADMKFSAEYQVGCVMQFIQSFYRRIYFAWVGTLFEYVTNNQPLTNKVVNNGGDLNYTCCNTKLFSFLRLQKHAFYNPAIWEWII